MKLFFSLLLLLVAICFFSCSYRHNLAANTTTNMIITNITSTKPTTKIWNFNNLEGWIDNSVNQKANYYLEQGKLKMFTNANSQERTKLRNVSTFGPGIYSWRVYVPEMGVGDRAGIGAFLYNNDNHELDFEIGYGTQLIRNQLKAEKNDLIAYMTSQANPFQSIPVKIKRNQWYILTIELIENEKNYYFVNWKINNKTVSTAQLTYGRNTNFKIYCSMENIDFIGDHIPSRKNYALFDWVKFTPIKKAK